MRNDFFNDRKMRNESKYVDLIAYAIVIAIVSYFIL